MRQNILMEMGTDQKNLSPEELQEQIRNLMTQELIVEREIARLKSEAKFSHFIKHFWNVVEPNTPYQHNWHIEAMADHLQAVAENKIKNLIIMVPPGHMKSLSVCVFWPAWVWIKRAEKRWLFSSYSQTLSIRDSVRCRQLIESHEYRSTFDIKWTLTDDQNQKMRFNNTATGYRIASSVGGTGTGERAHFIVADDPLNAVDANSEVERQNVLDWWDRSMSSRDADPKETHRVIIMQRLHEKDLAGHCERMSDYEVLKLPAEFDPLKAKITSIGWRDPRTEKGELLFPERFNEDYQKNQKEKLGSLGYAAQQQQNPTPQEGALFKRHWWKIESKSPSEILEVVQFWDCAQKPGITNDYSVCATWARTPNGYFLLHLYRDKIDSPTLNAMGESLYERFQPNAVVVEDKSHGTALIQHFLRNTTIPVLPFDPGQRDKEVRATAATPTVEAGKCGLPKSAEWLDDFLSEHERFPKGEHDDQVDTTSMAVEYFSRRALSRPRIRTL